MKQLILAITFIKSFRIEIVKQAKERERQYQRILAQSKSFSNNGNDKPPFYIYD
jgi:hypothetical protein